MRRAAYAIRHTWWALVFGIAPVVTAQLASPRADQQDSESDKSTDDLANDDKSPAEAVIARVRSHLTRLKSYDLTVTEAYEASSEFKRRQPDYKYHPPSRFVYRFRLEGNRFRRARR